MRTNRRNPKQLITRGFREFVASINIDSTKNVVYSIRPVLGVFYFGNENRSKGVVVGLVGLCLFRDLNDEVRETFDRIRLGIGLDLWAYDIVVGRGK
jgi:hypothetical protein